MAKKDKTITSETLQSVSVGQIKHRLLSYSIAAIVIGQVLIIIATALLYSLFDGMSGYLSFIITMTFIIVFEVIIMLIVVDLLIYPLDIIARTVSAIIGEKPTVYPPNPNRLRGPVQIEIAKAVDFLYTKESTPITPPDKQNSDAGQVALSLVHSLPVGIIALDYDYNILAFNDNAPIYQTKKDCIIQLDFRNSSQSLEQWFSKVRGQAISASQTWTRVQNVPSGSLETRHIYDVVASYHQHAVDGINLIVVTIDRTADYVDSENSVDFVALAAHELRTPLTVIRGYLDMLDEEIYDTATDEQKALLDRLNVSAKRLTSYVNNVLNANRYDRNHLQLKLTETTIPSIVADVRKDLDLRATTVNRRIDWDIPDNLPTVAADQSSIGEVITNLVDNAIKYSNDGGVVEVTAKRSGDFVAVSITDHGIGIARSVADHLFTKFYRSHRSRASVGGTGIGLYISRGIIESHGGTIGVNSTEGEGSTFTFTVPIYSTVKDKLASNDNSNATLISKKTGYIDNHGSVIK